MCADNPVNRDVPPPATFGTLRKPKGTPPAGSTEDSPHGPVVAASSAMNITAAQGLTTLITELKVKREFMAKQLAAELEARAALAAKIDGLERDRAGVEREIGLLQATLTSLTGSRTGDGEPALPVAPQSPEAISLSVPQQ